MILPMEFASHVLCILAKFQDFSIPVTAQENTFYTCGSFLDISHNLMFEASSVLEPCNFTFFSLKIL